MRASLYAAVLAIAVAASGTAGAACPSGKSRDCVVNFSTVPQISERIVSGEPFPTAPPPKAFPVDTKHNYTGPTIGTAPNTRRAPTVGYRWAIN